MKKLLIVLLALAPIVGYSQYQKISTHYDAMEAAHYILKGNIKRYLGDSTKLVFEKKNNRYVTHFDVDPSTVKSRLDKVFAKGKPEYTSRTNGGYIFTISVINAKDDLEVINYVTFHVDAFTQRIEEIEILLGK
jgi:transcriptional regulator CtsR